MMFSLLGGAMAEEAPLDTVTVYVSASENGEFLKGTGDRSIAYAPVEIAFEGANVENVFKELHNLYFEGEAEIGYASSPEGWITTFWGKSAATAGYLVNGNYAMSTADAVSDGDHITFWFYRDLTAWSDSYAQFDKVMANVTPGEALALTLESMGAVVGDAQITVDNIPREGKITDSEGKVTLEFENEGEYVVSAVKENVYLVPPVCIVKVASGEISPEPEPEPDPNPEPDPEPEPEPDPNPEPQPEQSRAEKLMENIAASYTENSTEWYVMDMGAYSALNPDICVTGKAKQEYINSAVKSITKSDAAEADFAKAIINLKSIGIDPEKLYKVNSNKAISVVEMLLSLEEYNSSAWVAPYTLIALNQGEYESEETENKIIDALLLNQTGEGCWNEWDDTIQTTANAISGLSFYYNTNEKVKTAVDKALVYLSSAQKPDGSFDAYGYGADSNTQAMVVTALSAVGIDADKDDRFIKNGISVYDALMSYSLGDATGFGYNDNITKNDYSTEQGFRALVAYSMFSQKQAPFNVYDFSALEKEPGRASSSGSSSGGGSSSRPSDDTIKVYFTLKSDDSYWIKRRSLTLDKNSTVCDAFVKACDSAGISYEGADKGYISSVTKGKETLEEFGQGADSGWMYKVNDKSPDIGIKDYRLSDGDNIVFFYTIDWTKTSGGASSGSSVRKNNASTVKNLINKIGTVTSESEDAVKKAREAYDSLTSNQKKLVTNYDVLLKAERALNELRNAENIFSDIKGHESIKAIDYMYQKGIMNGTTETSFEPDAYLTRAMFAVILHKAMGSPKAESKCDFADITEGEWYCEGISWASESGIIKGIGDNLFAPERNVTYEEAVAILSRLGGDDVSVLDNTEGASPWASKSVTWAIKNGIIAVDIDFKTEITRAKTAEIIYDYINMN